MSKCKTENFEEYTSWCYNECLKYKDCTRMLRESMFKRGEFPCPLFISYEEPDETTDSSGR